MKKRCDSVSPFRYPKAAMVLGNVGESAGTQAIPSQLLQLEESKPESLSAGCGLPAPSLTQSVVAEVDCLLEK